MKRKRTRSLIKNPKVKRKERLGNLFTVMKMKMSRKFRNRRGMNREGELRCPQRKNRQQQPRRQLLHLAQPSVRRQKESPLLQRPDQQKDIQNYFLQLHFHLSRVALWPFQQVQNPLVHPRQDSTKAGPP